MTRLITFKSRKELEEENQDIKEGFKKTSFSTKDKKEKLLGLPIRNKTGQLGGRSHPID